MRRPLASCSGRNSRELSAGHLDNACHHGGQLIDNETPSFEAIAVVAAGVRLSGFAILVRPAFAFAIVFNCRTSSLVHSRRTIFLALAIFALGCFHGEASIKRAAADNLRKRCKSTVAPNTPKIWSSNRNGH